MAVTLSLFQALQRFRDAATDRILWADAACIDEADVLERGQQVDIMGSIYSQAKAVLVWLGEDTLEFAETEIRLIRDINAHFDKHYWPCGPDDEVSEELRSIRHTPEDSPTLELPCWEALRRLLDLPWFGRVWVLQEVGLATTVTVYCGAHSISISEIVQLANTHSVRSELPVVALLKIGRLTDASAIIWSGFREKDSWVTETCIMSDLHAESLRRRKFTFADILSAASNFEATDRRDHVYAFLGHPAARLADGEQVIYPDYTFHSLELYMKVVVRCLQQEQSLVLLSTVDH
jgi:hypothetical protein